MIKFIIALSISSLTLLCILALVPIQLDGNLIYLQDETNDQYVTDQGLNSDDFSHIEKSLIFNDDLQYLAKSTSVDFIVSSVNPYVFSRDWSFTGSLEYDSTSIIIPNSYLFIDSDDFYHILITFEFPSRYANNHLLNLSYSEHIEFQLEQYGMILKYKDREFMTLESTSSQIAQDGFYEIYNPGFTQYFKNPTCRGYYYFKLVPIDTYEISVVSLTANFFERQEPQTDIILLGFSGFRPNPNQVIYIPQTIDLFYIKEDLI
ncbi:MAG: hypothetical protein KKH01_03495 [Firmicutes bacterium]|nr:hypothetical protein [Bacillota bacterium]